MCGIRKLFTHWTEQTLSDFITLKDFDNKIADAFREFFIIKVEKEQ